MRKCFVHIGTHKTGTTSIQATFGGSPVELAKGGLLYPKSGIPPGHFGHHNIAWELSDDSRFDHSFGTICDLLTEIRATDQNIIISSEDLECAAWNRSRFAGLINQLKECGLEVLIVIYLRNQVEY